MSLGQVPPHDLKTPEGILRIVHEEVPNGKLCIVAEFCRRDLAIIGLKAFRENRSNDQYILCNKDGPIKI